MPLLLGGDFRFRRAVERLRVAAGFADLRAVDDFLVLDALVPDLARVVVAFRRVVVAFRRVVDAFRRVVVAFLRVAVRRVLAAADLRADADFAALDFRRGFAFATDFAREVEPEALDLRLDDVVFLRRVVFDEPPVIRLVKPASAVVAFSSCATPLATSSCARDTALSTAPLLERFDVERLDRLVFLAAICVISPYVMQPPAPQYAVPCKEAC